MPRVLTFGECLGVAVTQVGQRLRTAATARLGVAGAEATVAIGLSRLGIDAAWVGCVGADELGERVRRELAAERVDVASVRVDPAAPTAFMLRERRTASETHVRYYRDGSAGSRLSTDDVDGAFDRLRPDVVHVTGITAALSGSADDAVRHAVERAAADGVAVSLDVNLRRTLPGVDRTVRFVRDVVGRCDVVFVGHDEADVLTGVTDPAGIAEAVAALGPREVVVKGGRLGALARCDGDVVRRDAEPVVVVDVIGAGDSFVAGYLGARLESRPVDERLAWGTRCAAATVGSDGDWEGLPNRADLDRWAAGEHTVR